MNKTEKQELLDIAWQSIKYGLKNGKPINVELVKLPLPLREMRASFVTIEKYKSLRGCIGTLVAHRPLAEDVANNAFSAAFHDSRFSPVNDKELPELSLHLSLLTKPEPILFTDENDLLNKIIPFQDGLILSDGYQRATFLPAVWESLPEPKQFLAHLKMKAGLPVNYWSQTIRFQRYQCEVIE